MCIDFGVARDIASLSLTLILGVATVFLVAYTYNLVDSYMIFLQTLNPDARLDIISRLTQSLKSEIKPKENLFAKSFGAWSGSESGDEIVKGIRDSTKAIYL